MRFLTVIPAAALPPGAREVFDIEDTFIAVFNVGGSFYAIEDRCTHDDGPLADGDLDDFAVTCPRHGARFDIRTGKVLSLPAVVDVPWFPVRVTDGQVQIGFED